MDIVTKLKQLESVLESMRIGVIVFSEQEEIIFVNCFARKLSFSSHQSLPENIRTCVKKVLAGEEEDNQEISLIRQGKITFFKMSCQALSSDSGRLVLLLLDDVSRIHHLENLRREFVGNVSHELKTPVTSIKAAVETLQDGAIDDPVARPRFLDIISRQADRLNIIIEDLLILSRLENEDDKISLHVLPLSNIVSEAVKHCELKARDKKIRIEIFSDNFFKAKVNESLMEQAILNLVDNAIKYSPENTLVKVIVFTEGDEVGISVSDQGRGIADEHLDRVFERFYRVDKARSRSEGGSGLGLSIVKHIAQVHQGRATVSSKLNQGSTFTIYLPTV